MQAFFFNFSFFISFGAAFTCSFGWCGVVGSLSIGQSNLSIKPQGARGRKGEMEVPNFFLKFFLNFLGFDL